ncbi:hypothetical protein ACOSQ2_012148 [Xanthoceras sorbifolium]
MIICAGNFFKSLGSIKCLHVCSTCGLFIRTTLFSLANIISLWCMVAVKYLIPRDKFGCSFLLVLWSNGMYKSAPCLGDFQAVYGGDVAPCFLSLSNLDDPLLSYWEVEDNLHSYRKLLESIKETPVICHPIVEELSWGVLQFGLLYFQNLLNLFVSSAALLCTWRTFSLLSELLCLKEKVLMYSAPNYQRLRLLLQVDN